MSRVMGATELSNALRTVSGPLRAVRMEDGAIVEAYTVTDVVLSADGVTVDLVLE